MHETPRDQEPTAVPPDPDDQHPTREATSRTTPGSGEDGRPMTDADQALENLKEMLDSGEENPG